MRMYKNLSFEEPIKFRIKLRENVLNVEADKSLFGSQPFLAVKTYDERYFHDTLVLERMIFIFYQFDKDSTLLKWLKRLELHLMTISEFIDIFKTRKNKLLKKFYSHDLIPISNHICQQKKKIFITGKRDS